jgi:hypothetical protein
MPINHKAGLVGPAFFTWNWSEYPCLTVGPEC